LLSSRILTPSSRAPGSLPPLESSYIFPPLAEFLYLPASCKTPGSLPPLEEFLDLSSLLQSTWTLPPSCRAPVSYPHTCRAPISLPSLAELLDPYQLLQSSYIFPVVFLLLWWESSGGLPPCWASPSLLSWKKGAEITPSPPPTLFQPFPRYDFPVCGVSVCVLYFIKGALIRIHVKD
jgi:hypothetical protein